MDVKRSETTLQLDYARRELEDWLRRNAEGQSMEDPSQAIQMLLDALDEES